jgi:hypothetical protein
MGLSESRGENLGLRGGGEVTGECRKLHDEELYILFSAQGIVEMNKCKRTRYVLYIAHIGTSLSGLMDVARLTDCRNTRCRTFLS